jgi:hypothetical protein
MVNVQDSVAHCASILKRDVQVEMHGGVWSIAPRFDNMHRARKSFAAQNEPIMGEGTLIASKFEVPVPDSGSS